MTLEQLERSLQQLAERNNALADKIHNLENLNLASKEKENKIEKIEEARLIMSAWTKIVDTQMHFNEMVMKVRSLAITLILAAFGAAAYAVQAPIFLGVYGKSVHIAFFIIIFGLTGWIALWVMDLGHFHKLLRGAVTKGMELEAKYKDNAIVGGLVGMTTAISNESRTLMGRKISAGKKIGIFYATVLVSGIAYCWVALNYIHKEDLAKDQVMKIQVMGADPNGFVLRVDPPAIVLKDERHQQNQNNSKGTERQ